MLLTIITVCKNEKDDIERTLRSVLSQSFGDFEYIVIDGASTDGTDRIVESYASHLSYWVSEPDKGIYDAMNKGILHSHGKYLLFLNGGDRLVSDSILDEIFNTPRTAEVLYGDVYKDRGTVLDLCRYDDYKTTPMFLFDHTLPHPGSLIQRALFNRIGTYDASFRLSGDYDFFLRSLVRGKASSEYVPLAISIFDTQGISQDAQWRSVRQDEDIRARKNSYSPIEYRLFSSLKFLYNTFVYRPRRKILSLLGKS